MLWRRLGETHPIPFTVFIKSLSYVIPSAQKSVCRKVSERMVGIIHHAGFSIQNPDPKMMIETEEGAGISLQNSALRLSGPHAPNFDLGSMMEFRRNGDHTSIELGNLREVHIDAFKLPIENGTEVTRISRPETLVTPHTTSTNTILPFLDLDAQNRKMYIRHRDPRNKLPAEPAIAGTRLHIANGFQAGPNHIQLNPQWSMSTPPELPSVFAIQSQNAKSVPIIASQDTMFLGNLNASAPFANVGSGGLRVRGALHTNGRMQVASGELSAPDSAHSITPNQWRAANEIQLTPHIKLQNDKVFVGTSTTPLKNVADTVALAIGNELQIGGQLKIIDQDGVLVVYDTRQQKVVRTLARLIAPPPMLLINSPHPMVQIANVPKETVLELALIQLFKAAETDDWDPRGSQLSYNIIVNPDNMATVDKAKNVLRIFSKVPAVTPQPLLRTGQVQVRAVSAMGALSPVLVIPFEDRGFVPPLPRTQPELIELTEGREVTLQLHDYFENPNVQALSNNNRPLEDGKSRALWTFSVNGAPPTKSPLVTIKASNQNTIFRFSVVAINEYGQASIPTVIQVKESYVWPPQQVQQLPAKITSADEDFATLDLSQYFRDPQGMTLNYRISTTNPSAKITVASPALLRVQAQNRNIEYPLQFFVSNGVKTITGSTTVQMQETYIAPPVVSPPTTATLTPMEIGDASSIQVDLSTRIRDPQNLPLTFSVNPSGNPNNARATIQGSRLIVQGQDRNTGPYNLEIVAFNGTKRTVFPVLLQEVVWPTPGLAQTT